MAALTRSALQQQERDYQSFGNSIMQAFNSQLRGLLSGTENWHTAFKSVLENLLIKFIEWCETSVEHYVLAEAMKTAATTSGVAARTGAEEAGAAASMGAQGAAMIRSILSSAAETFAGVFGFLVADHGAVRRRPRRRRPSHGRRHGGLRRLRRHRHVASSAGHADPGPSQRTRHARGRSGRLSSLLSEGDAASGRRASVAYPPDDEFSHFRRRCRLGLAMDEGEQFDDDESDRRAVRWTRRCATGPRCGLTQLCGVVMSRFESSSASIFCRRPGSSLTTRSPIGSQRVVAGWQRLSHEHLLRAGRLEDRLFLRDRPVAGAAPRMRDGFARLRLVLQLGGRESNCNIYPSTNLSAAARFAA